MVNTKMTPEAQRIAIAEACGWRRSTYAGEGRVGIGDYEVWVSPEGVLRDRFTDSKDADVYIPNYLSDLNAMHEAEKVLDSKQFLAYENVLKEIVYRNFLEQDSRLPTTLNITRATHATASQRAEAFLHTLNLWKD